MFDAQAATRALQGDGGDITEAKLADIVQLSERADYLKAAARATAALDSGCTDIRVIAPFLFGVFVDGGPDSLAAIFDVVALALTARWTVVRPETRKTAVVDSTLAGLFRGVVANIDFHEKTQSARYLAWAAQGALSAGSASLASSSALRAAIAQSLGKPGREARASTQLSELEARIRVHFSRVPLPPPERLAPEDAAAYAANDEPAPAPVRAAPPAPAAPVIELSPAMERFMAALDAFALLIERGDLPRAAIISEDIRRTTEAFDPKKFFPKLLLPYLRLQARHIQDILATRETMDGGTWSALEQLYQADLDAFLAE